MYFFFFSSRRRHTRCLSDWSSDVCSSDLRFVLWMGRADHPAWNVAQRFRLGADELDEVRAEIHAALRARGRTGCSWEVGSDRKSTRLNSSHLGISYAVFCLKKKTYNY